MWKSGVLAPLKPEMIRGLEPLGRYLSQRSGIRLPPPSNSEKMYAASWLN
jgi:hypothetical protein